MQTTNLSSALTSILASILVSACAQEASDAPAAEPKIAAAVAGSPPETGESLHRIDPSIVVANMEAAGFVCEELSDLLINSDDDLTQMVFEEGIRGKTSRFAMRFRNPD